MYHNSSEPSRSVHAMSETLKLLREGTWAETAQRVRSIPQYTSLRDIRLARVKTDAILSLAQFINTRRLLFAEALSAKILTAGIPLFRPVVVRIGHLTRLAICAMMRRWLCHNAIGCLVHCPLTSMHESKIAFIVPTGTDLPICTSAARESTPYLAAA